jgi:tetratricopeptide (TPR) repeat protein
MLDITKLKIFRALNQFLLLFMLAAGIEIAVLWYIYPRSYDIFWPHHSDFYAAVAAADNPMSLMDFFHTPRPVGALYFRITGELGTRGAIVANFGLVILNCTATTMFVKRFFKIPFDKNFLIVSAVYFFLVFAHPYQYVWSTYDIFTQVSYFFLLCAFGAALANCGAFLVFAFATLGFLAKETYAASALAIAVSWIIFEKSPAKTTSIKVFLALLCALAASFALNLNNRSPFTSGSRLPGNTYLINTSVESLISQMWQYAVDGLSFWLAIFIALVITFIVLAKSQQKTQVAISLTIAAMFAWLPNSFIPTHHFPGYSWNASYLLFAPVIILATSPRLAIPNFVTATFFAILALLIPLSLQTFYAKNSWILAQQDRQQLLMETIQSNLKNSLPGPQKILVSGISFPFSPFDFGSSLKDLGAKPGTKFYVIRYDLPATNLTELPVPPDANPVQFISPAQALRGKFDRLWLFRTNGTLFGAYNTQESTAFATSGFSASQMAAYPAVLEALRPANAPSFHELNDADGYSLLNCGIGFMAYSEPELALRCLTLSTLKIPENPYPYFFAGQVLSALKRPVEAKQYFEQAVLHDSGPQKNPAFNEGLNALAGQ